MYFKCNINKGDLTVSIPDGQNTVADITILSYISETNAVIDWNGAR